MALLDIDGDNLKKTMAAIARPDATLAITCDVADPAGVANAVAAVQGASAGSMRWSTMPASPSSSRSSTSPTRTGRGCSRSISPGRFCARRPRRRCCATGGGAIVNITSISGLRASTLRTAYGTSKAGLAHLTKQQAAELAALGIRVNAVAPGPVDTAMAKAVHTPEIRKDYHDHMPLNRYGLEEELAEVIFFLCSDRASYVTGQVIAVDGGFDSTGIGLPTLRAEKRNS